MPRVVSPVTFNVDDRVAAPEASIVVKLPAAAVLPPITTLSKVVVVIDRLLVTPADDMSQSSELIEISSPPSPRVTDPLKLAAPLAVKVELAVRVVNVPAAAVDPPIAILSIVEVDREPYIVPDA